MPGLQSIEGLASNLDISAIVDTIIQYERQPVTVLEQDKTIKTQQVAAFQAVLAKFLALKTSVFALKNESSFNKSLINVSDETIMTATADGMVAPGSYTFRVNEVARNHQLAGKGFDNAIDGIFGTGTIKLSTGDVSLTTITIDNNNNSLVGIKDAINNANVGVTATIINDGSSSNPYRLLITSDKTGIGNRINYEVSLTGGETIDLTGSSFDNPEVITFSSTSSSAVSLGSMASYTGNENKIYTFTVAGEGEQTVGTDNITINWSDGTNSGSIIVTAADSAVALFGDGANGLELSFSAGTMTGGDTFQVSTFAPLLQEASDAKISIGSDGTGGGSPIVITSDTNSFEDVIAGVKLEVHKVTDTGESVSINTDIDVDGIKSMLDGFVAKYNDVMKFIDEQFSYEEDSKSAGVLLGDYSLQIMQSSVRLAATSLVENLASDYSSLASIGIRSDANGRLGIVSTSALRQAIRDNFDEFVDLFTDSAVSTAPGIELFSTTYKTVIGDNYAVEITQAATQAYYSGASIVSPAATPLTLTSSNNVIKLNVDGIVSGELVLSEKTYSTGEALANEIQARINADSKIGKRGVTVEWVDEGATGFLKLTGSTYGSGGKVKISTNSVESSAFSALGLATGQMHLGLDVEGTINGEAATGKGQYLTGDEGNKTTDGLKLKITLTEEDLGEGIEGYISISKGIGSILDKSLDSITKSTDGTIARQTSALEKQIEELDSQIEFYEERLTVRREDLYSQFLAMESALSELQAESQYLEAQLEGLQSNWYYSRK